MFLSIGGWCFALLSVMWLVRAVRHHEPALAPLVSAVAFSLFAFAAIPIQQAALVDTSIAACHGHGTFYRELIEPRQSPWAILTAHPTGTRLLVCRDGSKLQLPVNLEGSGGWPSF